MKTRIYESTPLTARYDARASFYGKAQVLENGETQVLKSYDTYVCIIKGNHAFICDTYSNTTTRHIREFLRQNGFKTGTKQELVNMYSVDVEVFDRVIEKLGL